MIEMSREKAQEVLKILRFGTFEEIINTQEIVSEALDMAIEALKEQRPHGEWLFVQRGKFVDVVCPFCKEVGIGDLAYNMSAEEAKKRFFNGEYTIYGKTELPHFCSNCGSDNRKKGET